MVAAEVSKRSTSMTWKFVSAEDGEEEEREEVRSGVVLRRMSQVVPAGKVAMERGERLGVKGRDKERPALLASKRSGLGNIAAKEIS